VISCCTVAVQSFDLLCFLSIIYGGNESVGVVFDEGSASLFVTCINIIARGKIAVAANALILQVQIILADIANFLAVFANVRCNC